MHRMPRLRVHHDDSTAFGPGPETLADVLWAVVAANRPGDAQQFDNLFQATHAHQFLRARPERFRAAGPGLRTSSSARRFRAPA